MRSTLINLIRSIMDRYDSVASSLANSKFRILIGNGLLADFWSNNWTGRYEFKQAFPRIFVLVVVNHGPVSNFGQWDNGVWHWNI